MTQPPPPPGYGAQPGQPYPPVRQTSSDATLALVLAILSWVVCPVVLAIVALVFASKARSAIAASNGWLDGSGMVTAAKVIAWINIAVAVLGLVLVLVLAIFAASNVPTDLPSTGNAVLSLLG